MTIQAIAPGKLVLLGEYAVLEGAPALVAATNRFAKVQVKPSGSEYFEVEAPIIGVPFLSFFIDDQGLVRFLRRPLRQLRFFRNIFEFAVAELYKRNRKLNPVHISLDTTEFFLRKGAEKLGLGSSAALTVGMLAALFAYVYGGPDSSQFPDRDELFQIALTAHRKAQGNVGSGIDIGACVYGGILRYKLLPPSAPSPAEILKLAPLKGVYYLPIWTGTGSSTSEMVARFFDFKRRDGNGYRTLLKELSDLAEKGCQAFLDQKRDQFLEIYGLYFRKMTDIGNYIKMPVVSEEHQEIARLVFDFGGVYKPSGAGGGDLGIALVKSPDELTELASLVQKAGYEVVHLQLGSKGFEVTVDA